MGSLTSRPQLARTEWKSQSILQTCFESFTELMPLGVSGYQDNDCFYILECQGKTTRARDICSAIVLLKTKLRGK